MCEVGQKKNPYILHDYRVIAYVFTHVTGKTPTLVLEQPVSIRSWMITACQYNYNCSWKKFDKEHI